MSRLTYRTSLALSLTVGAAIACSDPIAPAPRPRLASSAAVMPLAPVSPEWQADARGLIATNRLSPLAAGRVTAALSVAQYAAVSAADERLAVEDALPGNGLEPGGRSRLEARRGAVAGASAQVLAYLFPAAASSLEEHVLRNAAGGPGRVHPQFTRGLALGRGIGDGLVDRLQHDNFTVPWTGTIPTGPGIWITNGTPAGGTFPGVTPYLLTSSDQFRPAPPPAFGSAELTMAVNEIKALAVGRTPEQLASALYWNFPTGTYTAIGYWNDVAAAYIAANGLDERAATHTFALMHAAMMDALIACWEAKYHYLVMRPSQIDATITLTFALPNHPSYPSGHSCTSSAAATVLASFFPDRRTELQGWVIAAGLSRMYAGIHYRFDVEAGQQLGAAVAQWAIGIDHGTGLLAAMH